jgi:hypothetical protein
VRQAVLSHPSVTECAVGVAAPPAAEPRRCATCGLGEDYPEAGIDADGCCRLCRDFQRYRDRAAAYFRTMDDLAATVHAAAARRGGRFDCLMLLSGGKDSTYAQCRLAELTPRILAATLDNGFIAEGAKANIRRVCATLGIEHTFMSTPDMNAIFADSLERHANVCNGCFKTIYTLGLRLARSEGIPLIVTGLSRGQLFETRLAPELFAEPGTPADAIDRIVLEARKQYHRQPDAAARALNRGLFDDDCVFEEVTFVDFYRYCDVSVDAIYARLAEQVAWLRPVDTGRSTNCLINDVGIHVHKRRRGFHNYALPYSWDVRMGHKSRAAALEELDDTIDGARVARILAEIGYAVPADAAKARLVCHYVAADGSGPQAIRDHLATRLPREIIPVLVPVERLPLTPNGKVDRAALPPAPEGRSVRSEPPTAPRTETEARILAIWQEVLRRADLGTRDNFFDAGGDSIAASRVASTAARDGLAVSAVDVLILQTVAAIASAADSAPPVSVPSSRRAELSSGAVERLAALFGRKT